MTKVYLTIEYCNLFSVICDLSKVNILGFIVLPKKSREATTLFQEELNSVYGSKMLISYALCLVSL